MCIRDRYSDEVWKVLGAVKSEFETFEGVLQNTQKRLEMASSELDKLVGVRTRAIRRKLKNVIELEIDEANRMLISDEDE